MSGIRWSVGLVCALCLIVLPGGAAAAGNTGVSVNPFDVTASASPREAHISLFSETWTKYAGNPVLSSGPPGSWDQGSLGHASVIYEGGSYKMWYSGCTASLRPQFNG